MIQYNNIVDAIVALTQKYGIEIFNSTPRFISLLSDWTPNLPEEQHIIRRFSRANGMIAVAGGITEHKQYTSVLSAICSTAVQASKDDLERHAMVRIAKDILGALDKEYSTPANPKSVFECGMEYYRRPPKEENIPIAILILEDAGQSGFTDALYYISNSYLKGKGIQQDSEKGLQYLELAAKNNNKRAKLELAEYLWKGINVDQDAGRAVSLLKDLDDPNAMYMLGEIFRENAEYTKAFEYYVLAAEKNHVYAQYDTAIAYATGQGTKRNIQEAKRWLHSAASLGHSEARRKLEELGEKWD